MLKHNINFNTSRAGEKIEWDEGMVLENKQDLFVEIGNFEKKLTEYIQGNLSKREAFNPTIKKLSLNVFDKVVPGNNGTLIKFNDINKFKNNINEKLIGIYYFLLVTENFDDFKLDWTKFKEENEDNVPALNKGEYTVIKADEMYLLYIGKSEYSLNKRINEHINSGSSSTYCLRIKEFLNKNPKKYSFEYGYLTTEDQNKEATNKILNMVENFLRKKFPPLLGRK